MDNDNNSSDKITLSPYGPRSTFKYTASYDGIPWVKDVIPKYIIPKGVELARRGLKPGIRGMLYYLESIRILEKNDKMYRKMIKSLSTARKGTKRSDGTRNDPTLPRDFFSDSTRHIIKNFNDRKRSLEDYIYDGIAHFRRLPNGFRSMVPRWLDQPNYVEIWVEKQGWIDNLKVILAGRDVVIVPNRGNSSIKFLHDNLERLVDKFDNDGNEHKVNIHVLYLGDLDPPGWDMDRQMQNALSEKLGGPWSEFRRIGITYEQIVNNNLKHLLIPTPEVLKKLSKPKLMTSKRFKEHFGSLFQVELDAMEIIPNFEKFITDPIDELYDRDIREQVLERPEYSQEPEMIKEQIMEALYDMIGDFNAEDSS